MELNEIIKGYDFALRRSRTGFMIFKSEVPHDLKTLKLTFSKDIKIEDKNISFDHLLNKNIFDIFYEITNMGSAFNLETVTDGKDNFSRKIISFTDEDLSGYKFSFYANKISTNVICIAFEDVTDEIQLEKEIGEIVSILEPLNSSQPKKIKVLAEDLKKNLEFIRKEKDGLEDFTERAVHDLIAPLNTIQGFGKLLQEKVYKNDNIDEEVETFASVVSKKTSKLRQLIYGLLEFSKEKNKKLDFTDVNLQNVIKEIMQDLEIDIESRHAQISCSNLPSIKANKTSVKSLFQNLISNALKYSRLDIDPVINIYHKTPENDAEKFSIIIKDNGVGMKDDTLSRITMPFVRVKNKKDTEEGTGLGLSICKEIVDKLEGNISFSSSLTKGTEAIISLPKEILL